MDARKYTDAMEIKCAMKATHFRNIKIARYAANSYISILLLAM